MCVHMLGGIIIAATSHYIVVQTERVRVRTPGQASSTGASNLVRKRVSVNDSL